MCHLAFLKSQKECFVFVKRALAFLVALGVILGGGGMDK